jgi:hypothetical protein
MELVKGNWREEDGGGNGDVKGGRKGGEKKSMRRGEGYL